MKRTIRKVVLRRERVRELSGPALVTVMGGVVACTQSCDQCTIGAECVYTDSTTMFAGSRATGSGADC